MSAGNNSGIIVPGSFHQVGSSTTSTSSFVVALGGTSEDAILFDSDFVLIYVLLLTSSRTISTPPGTEKVYDSTSFGSCRLALFTMRKTRGVDINLTFTLSGSSQYMWFAQPLRGVEVTDPIQAMSSAGTSSTNTASSMTIPTISADDGTGSAFWMYGLPVWNGQGDSWPSAVSGAGVATNTTSHCAMQALSWSGDLTTSGVDGFFQQTPNPTGSMTLTMTAAIRWHGLGVVLRAAQSDFMPFFGS